MKNIIFYFSISYIIIFSILTINTLGNVKETIDFGPDDNYSNKIQNLKIAINKIEDLNCKDNLNNLLQVYENTNFIGNVNLKNIYKTLNELDFLTSNYFKVINNCQIEQETLDKLEPYMLNSSFIYESIINKYLFQYELSLKDKYERIINETKFTNTQFRMNKLQELDIITKIIEVQNEK